METVLKYNNLMLEKIKTEIASVSSKPRFIYTHLFMPHYPYYFDENGDRNNLTTVGNEYDQNAYKNYLIYSNKVFLQLIDTILKKSSKPPIIILLGDHGFRQFKNQRQANFHFMNLNAIYLPNRDYKLFYNGMSNVNLFRVILNSQFQQELPLLKDSCIVAQ